MLWIVGMACCAYYSLRSITQKQNVVYLLYRIHSSTWCINLLLVYEARHRLQNRYETCLFSCLFSLICLNYKIFFSDMVIDHNAYEIHNILF